MIRKATIRRETGLIEHVCEHGVGHPAIGSVIWMRLNGMEGYEVHGCCGCCQSKEWQEEDMREGLEIANRIILEQKKLIKELRNEQ